MRHVLVVADETVGSDALLEAVTARLAEEPCEFWLLVPATAPHDVAQTAAAWASPATLLRFDAAELAHQRLHRASDWLSRSGATVHGEVGSGDALRAIAEVLEYHPIDEILIATPPRHVSHWLHHDLARKVRHKTKLPVTEVAAKLQRPE
jgi:hypothetical protein